VLEEHSNFARAGEVLAVHLKLVKLAVFALQDVDRVERLSSAANQVASNSSLLP